MFYRLLIWLTILFNCICVFADNRQYAHIRFEKYGVKEGLSSSKVFDIKQDAEGYIWCATDEGLCRYDGINFKKYKWHFKQQGNLGNQVVKLYCTNNHIYCATNFGLVSFEIATETFTFLKNKHIDTDNNLSEVHAIAPRKGGGLWIGTSGPGVFYFDPQNNRFSRFKYNSADSRILSLYESGDGKLYIGTHFGGLDVVNLKDGHVTNYRNSNHLLPNDQIESIVPDSHGNIWIGTWYGLMRFRKGSQIPEAIDIPELATAKVNAITEDKYGKLWVGTENYLCAIDLAGVDSAKPSANFYHESETDTGLSYKTVRSVLSDKNGNLWIGMYGGGVNFVNRMTQRFNYITSDLLLPNSLSYKRVSAINEDKNGNLWISTDGGGINYYNIRENTFRKITASTPGANLSDNAILCALYDSEGDLWAGTYKGVLNRMKSGTNQFIHYFNRPGDNSTLPEGDLSCIFEDSKKRIWVGQRSGLSYLDKATNKFHIIEPLRWVHITEIQEGKDCLWIATFNGIYKYSFPTGEVTSLSKKLNNVFINSFETDEDGNFWIGTEGLGLWQYSPKGDSLKIYDSKENLNSAVIRTVLLRGDDLWLGTNKDIERLSLKTGKTEIYSFSDGVQPGSFLMNSGIVLKSGMLAMGGTEGMNIFDPNSVADNARAIPVTFTDFLLFNQSVAIRSEENMDSPLEVNINSTDRLVLDYDDSVFTIEYLGINFSAPEHVRYAYFLKGVDSKWNHVGQMRSVTYRNLSPGTYEFMVKASTGDFDNNDFDNVRKLIIKVKPPFWMTWWAYVIYFILLVIVAYLIYRMTLTRIRIRNRINMERFEKEKQKELYQAKMQFFANASHELRNPLTMIKAPLDRLLDIEKDSNKKDLLTLIKRNTNRVIKNVNEVLDIRKIDYGQLTLKVQKGDVVPILHEIADTFEGVIKERHINFRFYANPDKIEGWFNANFVDKIVYNLLSNAFKYVKDYDEIILNTFVEKTDIGNLLHIEISDTGVGIDKSHLKKIFDCFYQIERNNKDITYPGSGIGLYLVKSLVELHKGHVTVESKVNVGTTFKVVIPIDRSVYNRAEISMHRNPEEIQSVSSTVITKDSPVVENENETGSEAEKQPQKSTKRYSVLVVDDEADIRNFLAMELGNKYEVETASDGAEAYEKALATIPDIIISDVIMPNMDGIELCSKIKENVATSHIPFILLTAKSSHEDRLEGLDVGADSYIPKPFDIRHVHIRIEKLISNREALKKKFMKKMTLVSETPTEAAPAIDNDEKIMQKIITYINEHISDPDIKGETIAAHIGMSRMNLHRKLKALVGLSAGDLIRAIRLDNASRQLLSTTKSISEISYDLGFSSPSYFYICFVKKYGVSPTEYREKKGEAPTEI